MCAAVTHHNHDDNGSPWMNWTDLAAKRGQRANELSTLFTETAEAAHVSRKAAELRVDALRERLEALRRHSFFIDRRFLATPTSLQGNTAVSARTLRADLDACLRLNAELSQRIESLAVLLDDDENASGPPPQSARSPRSTRSPRADATAEQALVAIRLGRSASFNTLQTVRVLASNPALDVEKVSKLVQGGQATQSSSNRVAAGSLLVANEALRQAIRTYTTSNREECEALREKVKTLEELVC